jgi:CRISPR-associated protein (TIGR02584 family)
MQCRTWEETDACDPMRPASAAPSIDRTGPMMSRRTPHMPSVYVPTAGSPVRRVLFTVCGLSPQVITESIYALAVAAPIDERFVPTEVHVLTTSEGAQRVRLALLSDHPGGYARLLRDYNLPPITFGEAQIHLVSGADGQPLTDIRSEDDNARMADAVTELVRGFTADESCALHVSIAGGRKTMGFYAGYALSLFGREQDRLSHVLVSAPFESSWEFFYPTPYPQVIATQGGRELVDASTAEVRLAQIPFVRLRPVLPAAMLDDSASFAAAVQAAERHLAAPRLTLDVPARCIEADGLRIHLAPWSFALMAVLAQRAQRGAAALTAPTKDEHDASWARAFLADLRAVVSQAGVPDSVEQQLATSCSGDRFSQHRSRLVRSLTEALGPGRVPRYFDDGGRHRGKRYRIPLPAEAIEIRRGGEGVASLPNDASRPPTATVAPLSRNQRTA